MLSSRWHVQTFRDVHLQEIVQFDNTDPGRGGGRGGGRVIKEAIVGAVAWSFVRGRGAIPPLSVVVSELFNRIPMDWPFIRCFTAGKVSFAEFRPQ